MLQESHEIFVCIKGDCKTTRLVRAKLAFKSQLGYVGAHLTVPAGSAF